MKKILVTEEQYKLISENDEVMQYQSTGSENKHFFSTLKGTDINWDSSKPEFEPYDNWDESVINIDWTCTFIFSENGFKVVPKIIAVAGELKLTAYNWDTAKRSDPFIVKIDSRRDYKIQLPSYGLEVDNNELIFPSKYGSFEINLDTKIIKF